MNERDVIIAGSCIEQDMTDLIDLTTIVDKFATLKAQHLCL